MMLATLGPLALLQEEQDLKKIYDVWQECEETGVRINYVRRWMDLAFEHYCNDCNKKYTVRIIEMTHSIPEYCFKFPRISQVSNIEQKLRRQRRL